MKNVKIPVARWHCTLTHTVKERWRGGDGGMDGKIEGWRDSSRKGDIGGKTEGFV